MSHVSVCRTKVLNPNPQILSEAIKAVAQMLGLRIVEDDKLQVFRGLKTIRDRYDYVSGDVILYDPQYNRYFGVRCGESLIFEYDSYGWVNRVQEIKQKIIQTYVHFAVIQQLSKMGYQVSNLQELEGKIICEVVKA